MIVRDIIEEALRRANVVPRRQTAPGYLLETGLRLLQGIVSTYNKDNYLSFTMNKVDIPSKEFIHIYDQDQTMLGEYDHVFDNQSQMTAYVPSVEDYVNHAWAVAKDNPNQYYGVAESLGAYYWDPITVDEYDYRAQQIQKYLAAYHIHIPNVAKLNNLSVNRGDTYGMLKLHFLPHAEFDNYINNDLYWTYKELAQGEWLIQVKKLVASSSIKLRLDYNCGFSIDLDTDVRIPDNYIELLIVSLTHKLAIKYPRIDDAQMERLAREVTVMLENVSTPKAEAKYVTRDMFDERGYTADDVLRGRMFY